MCEKLNLWNCGVHKFIMIHEKNIEKEIKVTVKVNCDSHVLTSEIGVFCQIKYWYECLKPRQIRRILKLNIKWNSQYMNEIY